MEPKILQSIPAKHQLKQRVRVDGGDIVGTVTGILFRHDGLLPYVLYEVEWLHNGINYSHWLPEYRLELHTSL